MNKHFRLTVTVGSLATALALVGCSAPATSDGDANAPIIIGDAGAQAGWLQLYDQATHYGAQLAVNDINEAGGVLGRQLELRQKDSESDKEGSYNAALELAQGGAQAIMTTCDYDFGAPAAQAVEGLGVPAMAACASDPQMGLTGCGPLCFTMATTTNVTGSLMAEYAYNELGARTVAVLTDTSLGYSQSLSDYFVERWTALAGEDSVLEQQTFTNADTSVAGQITAIEAADADFIWLPSYLPGQGTAIRQIRAAGIDSPILVGETLQYGQTVLDATGDPNLSDVYGVMYGYVDQFGGTSPEEGVQRLVDAYTELVGEGPDSSMFLTGYGVVQAFAEGMEACGCTTGQELADAIAGITDMKVADTIDTTFTADSHSPIDRSMAVFKWTNGTNEFMGRFMPDEIVPPKA